jgi:hypothetical protein
MRLNDIKVKPVHRVNEKLENWIGNYGASAVQQMKNRLKGDTEGELSVAEKMGKNKFINDFVARAYATLNSEIQSGRVDPSLSGKTEPQAEPQAEPKEKPAEPQGQALDLDALKKRREAEKAAGIQAQQDAQAQMKKTADANAASSAADNALVARVRAEKEKPGFQQDKGLIRQAAVKGIHERRYQKLNSIFESLLQEAESVGQFFKRWLPTYAKGVDLSDSHTQELIQKIEDTYAQDKGKTALTQLANAAYAASFAPGFGSQAQQGKPDQQGAQASDAMVKAISTASNAKELAAGIRTAMTRLNALDKTAYTSFVQELVKAANTPAPAAPVSEAKKSRK